ncbi:citrate/2-methylcitrate synthase [Limnochorda pilosa]|uniref:citrate/2-methylcitrate synthase n=1 Tax=Limnochorda pilosa TaxID=1555112 RepID=UPI001DDD92D6|nr:citrate/2-methylcitrate synthase [Limnochorda pilosa]MBO2485553.1 citrate synthase [Bacillota bacterium]MBO2518649.1 citrate synthase [Bacillota bacterium]
MSTVRSGLEGVMATSSAVSFIDGDRSLLTYRGYSATDLAQQSTFEETAYLLLEGELPTRAQLEAFVAQLEAARPVPQPVLDRLAALPQADPMALLRTGVSLLAHFDPDRGRTEPDALRRTVQRLVAQMPTLVAAIGRLGQGLPPIPPLRGLGPTGRPTATQLLFMLQGREPEPESVRLLDIAFILHADHELNASTFTGRVIAATLSDIHSGVVGALGALKGPLHGGANELARRMFETIGEASQAAAWTQQALARKERIMGMGHRVYRQADPRAEFLRQELLALRHRPEVGRWLDIALEVERVVREAKGLHPNPDFFTAILYGAVGIPTPLFTPVFAVSRVAGWGAHVLEQLANNRLIRPRAQYVGPGPRPFVRLPERT